MSQEYEAAAHAEEPDPGAGQLYGSLEEELHAYGQLRALSGEKGIDVRGLVHQQIAQLDALQRYIFTPEGKPKSGMKIQDVKGYMTASIQLLTMLQKFNDALATDEDFRRVEQALEMTFEEVKCPEFMAAFEKNLENIKVSNGQEV